MRLACVSVDLDEIPCYTAIHGLPMPAGDEAHAIYRRAVPRFVELFDELRVPATFFVVGRDLEAGHARDTVRHLVDQGHEIGNHSQHHHYDLTRQPPDVIHAEVEVAAQRIAEVTGARPAGFRAPGYTITDEVFEVLEATRHRYDSSVFPCPAYYGAKAAAMGAIRLRGRTSKSVLDDARVLFAPADPYRVGRPYYGRGDGLLELPIGVTRDLTGRLPFIGTSIALGGPRVARLLTRLMAGRPLVNLELHGIDLADAEEDGLAALARHQPDLSRSAYEKEESLRVAIDSLREMGYELTTLADAALRFLGGETLDSRFRSFRGNDGFERE